MPRVLMLLNKLMKPLVMLLDLALVNVLLGCVGCALLGCALYRCAFPGPTATSTASPTAEPGPITRRDVGQAGAATSATDAGEYYTYTESYTDATGYAAGSSGSRPGSSTVAMDGCYTGMDGCCTGGGSAAGFLRIWFCRICSISCW